METNSLIHLARKPRQNGPYTRMRGLATAMTCYDTMISGQDYQSGFVCESSTYRISPSPYPELTPHHCDLHGKEQGPTAGEKKSGWLRWNLWGRFWGIVPHISPLSLLVTSAGQVPLFSTIDVACLKTGYLQTKTYSYVGCLKTGYLAIQDIINRNISAVSKFWFSIILYNLPS